VNDITQDQHEIKLADDQGKHAVVIEMD
jgi:hypothetical protein